MLDIEFDAHNHEVQEVWNAYFAGDPIRIPVFLGINVRYYLLSPWLNPQRITFESYSEDPDLMMDTQLAFLDYVYHSLLQDAHLGLPEDSWKGLKVDLQNYYDAGWFGCPVRYHDGQVPDTEPILTDDRKRMLFDTGIPDPLSAGIMGKNMRFLERMRDRAKTHTYKGLPVDEVMPSGLNTDGVFTVAASLRGATALCIDVIEDPEYVHELLAYIAEATIMRIKAWRAVAGDISSPPCWSFADDSAQLLSDESYREFVLPHHKRLISELAGEGPHAVHMCGDAAHLFKTMRDELNVMSFDTGFPIDFGRVRRTLGPDVEIKGGPSISFLAGATPDGVRDEVARIFRTGVMEGGRFILREGNNLAPGTPEDNVNAIYLAAKELGRYQATTGVCEAGCI